MTDEELSRKIDGVSEQYMQARGALMPAIVQHQLTMEDVDTLCRRGPAFDSLPDPVKALMVKGNELFELKADLERKLVRRLHNQGCTISEIAEQIGLDEERVMENLGL